jgi:hypothetical protein
MLTGKKKNRYRRKRNLTVLCPGIILEIEANFKLLSPPLEIQIKVVSSCDFNHKQLN